MRMICLCHGPALFPFEAGGNFSRAQKDPSALLTELRIEREEIRARRRQVRERIELCTRQISACSTENVERQRKEVIAWFTGAAVVLIFGLLFSTGAMVMCGACGSVGVSVFLLGIAAILVCRALGELRDLNRTKKSCSIYHQRYNKELEEHNAELYKLNLREAELDESIKAAQRFQ